MNKKIITYCKTKSISASQHFRVTLVSELSAEWAKILSLWIFFLSSQPVCFLFISRHRLRSLESFSLPTSREDASVAFAKEFPRKFYGIPRFLNLRKAAETFSWKSWNSTWHGYHPHYLCKGKDGGKRNEPETVINNIQAGRWEGFPSFVSWIC